MMDLTGVTCKEMVEELVRRAPTCAGRSANAHKPAPMMLIGTGWHTCPVCGETEDFAD